MLWLKNFAFLKIWIVNLVNEYMWNMSFKDNLDFGVKWYSIK